MLGITKRKIARISYCLLFVATPVFAANIFFEAKTKEVRIGEQFEVNLIVHMPKENGNAFEGSMIFSGDLVEVKDVRDGNSIIHFWIDKPKTKNGIIMFSGITPGGFNGEKGLIFSAIFEAKKDGVARFEMSDARVLRNDGIGSEAALVVTPLTIVVSKGVSAGTSVMINVQDGELPETFRPEIAREKSLFEGRYFLVFATQDKESGIDHYEICEGRRQCVIAESPYLLENQRLHEKIFVKAVDKHGNERVEIVYPLNFRPWYKDYWFFAILMIGVLSIAYIARKKYGHHS